MWQLVDHPLFGQVKAWVPPQDLWDALVWKVGTLQTGQVWAQFSDDGPLRPATLVQV